MKGKKISWLILSVVFLVLFALVGCMPSAAPAPDEDVEEPDVEVPEAVELNVFYVCAPAADGGLGALTKWFKGAEVDFEALHPHVDVVLPPMFGDEAAVKTKTTLTLQTDDTVDVAVVDGFLVPAVADFLSPLPVDRWPDWEEQFSEAVRASTTIDGNVYAVLKSTDTRGLHYNIEVFEEAGVSVPFAPKSWDDLLGTIQELHNAGVAFPIWMNISKAQSEATTMQTFQMLLSGTNDWIFEDGKWVVGSEGFIDSLRFLQTLHEMGIYTDAELAMMGDAMAWRVVNQKFPESEDVAIVLDGNWKGYDWISALPDTHADVISVTPMPNQAGDGFTSMSGGWTLAVPALSHNKDLAFDFITVAANKENLLARALYTGDMTTRADTAADSEYKEGNIYRYMMSEFTEFTMFRPGHVKYPGVSVEIQIAVDSVIIGGMTAEEAAANYDEAVKRLVGDGNWVRK